MDVNVFSLAANQIKQAITLFADVGIPSLTFALAKNGISICEIDSAGALVVSCFFDARGFLVYSGVNEEILFTVDTLAIASSLKTCTSSCCLRLGFEGGDAQIIPKRLILTRTVDSPVTASSSSGLADRSPGATDQDDDPLSGAEAGSLSFRYEVPILECAPSVVKIDSSILENAYNKLSFLIRHSTMAQIVKEFTRMQKKKMKISSIYRASHQRVGVLFSSKVGGHAAQSSSSSPSNQANKGSREEIEVILLDETFSILPENAPDDQDFDFSGLRASQQIGIVTAPSIDSQISGVFSVKQLQNQLKSQLAKQIQCSLLPPSCTEEQGMVEDDEDTANAANDNDTVDAVLIIRQEMSLGVVNVVSPTIE